MLKRVGLALLATPAVVLAQEQSNSFDLSAASTAATGIQTSVVSFFTNSVGPMVLAIGAAVFAVSMILVVLRWGRRPTSGR